MEIAFTRPRLRSHLVIEMQRQGGTLTYLIRDPIRNRYWQCGVQQYQLLALCTGELTPAEIETRYSEQTHIRLRPEQLDAALQKLDALGFLAADETQTDAPSRSLAKEQRPFELRRVVTKRWALCPTQRLLAPLEAPTRWLFSPGFLVVCVLLAVVTGWIIVHGGWMSGIEAVFVGLYLYPSWIVWGQFTAALLITALFHESAHALTLQHFGRRPGAVGLGVSLLGGVFFYIDIGEIWHLTDRRQRVAVSMAGPLSSLVVGAVGAIAWWLLPRSTIFSSGAATLMAAGLLTAVYNSFPFARTDGYFALSDWVRIPNLDRKAQAYLTQTFFLLFRRQRHPKRKRPVIQHLLLAGYGLLALLVACWLLLVTISFCFWIVVTVVPHIL